MRRTWYVVGGLLTIFTATTFSQSGRPPALATYVMASEIQKVVGAPGGGDRPVKIVDMGKYNISVAVLRRGATKAGAPVSAINHTKVTEVYYIVSGSGTLVTGGEVRDAKPLAADGELVREAVGPSNNGTFVKPAQSQKVGPGDMIIIPAGVYHGFSEVPEHVEYVTVRPDVEKVLPAGFVSPFLK
jgi:mannose-6-phosphate isomerase-like protein (cupin superfamily)